ncbi:MAG: hypothetical protein R2848_03700 [Thermomicrobiales bacterium]
MSKSSEPRDEDAVDLSGADRPRVWPEPRHDVRGAAFDRSWLIGAVRKRGVEVEEVTTPNPY